MLGWKNKKTSQKKNAGGGATGRKRLKIEEQGPGRGGMGEYGTPGAVTPTQERPPRTGRGTGEKPDLRGPEAGDEGWMPKARGTGGKGRRRHLGGQLGWCADRVSDANSMKEAMAVPGCGGHIRRQAQTPPWRRSGQNPPQPKQGPEAPRRGCRLRSRGHGGGGWSLLETRLSDQLCIEQEGSGCLALVLRALRSGMHSQAVDRRSPLSGKGVTTVGNLAGSWPGTHSG